MLKLSKIGKIGKWIFNMEKLGKEKITFFKLSLKYFFMIFFRFKFNTVIDSKISMRYCFRFYKNNYWQNIYWSVAYFLFKEGFKGAAEKFRIESGIQPSVDLDTLDERIKIRDAIQNGKIQEAIELVNNLHPELLDCDRYLFFHLQVLLYIDVIAEVVIN